MQSFWGQRHANRGSIVAAVLLWVDHQLFQPWKLLPFCSWHFCCVAGFHGRLKGWTHWRVTAQVSSLNWVSSSHSEHYCWGSEWEVLVSALVSLRSLCQVLRLLFFGFHFQWYLIDCSRGAPSSNADVITPLHVLWSILFILLDFITLHNHFFACMLRTAFWWIFLWGYNIGWCQLLSYWDEVQIWKRRWFI